MLRGAPEPDAAPERGEAAEAFESAADTTEAPRAGALPTSPRFVAWVKKQYSQQRRAGEIQEATLGKTFGG